MDQFDQLDQLATWLDPLINKLEASERAKLARHLGDKLRRENQQRIKDQVNPDGTPYAPRKSRNKKGRIKRAAMFRKLRLNKHMKLKTTANDISLGFLGNVAKIARIHYEGQVAEVRPGGPEVKYEERKMLGFAPDDEQLIMNTVIEYLDI
jgi:phage virion morphogenesis protein